jgi:general secretion pathway protein E
MDIGVPSYLIGATLLGVVAQRLVRTLCQSCKSPTQVSRAAWISLAGTLPLEPDEQFHRAVGCDDCRNTGFKGREGLYEILRISESLAAMINRGANSLSLRRRALEDGMLPLRHAGAIKVALGRTTIEEVLSLSPFDRVDE